MVSETPADPRVALAIERTYLAWIRTGLAMMGFGFVVARFGVFLRELERARDAVPPPARGVSQVINSIECDRYIPSSTRAPCGAP